MVTTRKQGMYTEDLACQYLKNKGFELIERNYSSRFGEIDLIMQDNKYIVFIEVRYRKSNIFGSATESVTYTKQQKIIKTASLYLQKHKKLSKFPARFDVVSISGPLESDNLNSIDFDWISNAFEV